MVGRSLTADLYPGTPTIQTMVRLVEPVQEFLSWVRNSGAEQLAMGPKRQG